MRVTNQKIKLCFAIAITSLFAMPGCRSSFDKADLTPASEVLNASCCKPDNETQINFLTLRLQQPDEYVLDKGDTLGVYIQGITGDKDVPPPVHFPEDPANDPALGYPVPIRDDGYISLPLINPLRVSGLTLGQAETRIRQAYTKDKKILLEGTDKIIVTLMRRRTYNVLVIREDAQDTSQFSLRKNETFIGEQSKGETFSIELAAYENDVLHALSETGGMPGEDALNEILVLRGAMNGAAGGGMPPVVQAIGQQGFTGESPTIDGADVVRIPIKGDPGSFPALSQADITLNDGDVLYIKGRPRDVYYTGGLLDGGRFPLPRDYDIDVLEAISLAGGSGLATAGGGSGNTRGLGSVLPATQVTVIRKCGCEQVTIDVDLRYAQTDPSERVIVQPGDLIILEYRKRELFVNSVVSALQFGGVFNLFR